MATPNRPLSNNKYPPQYILNNSYDEDYNVLAFEPMVFNGPSATLKRLTSDQAGSYKINDIDKSSTTVLYYGFEDPDGVWKVLKKDVSTSTAPSFRYATMLNNGSTTTYATAWTNRASLTYNTYATAF